MGKSVLKNTLLLVFMCSFSFPQEVKVIGEGTIKNGPKVLILDDGTWKEKPKEIFNIPTGNSYYEGPADAKVTIIEWMDYQ